MSSSSIVPRLAVRRSGASLRLVVDGDEAGPFVASVVRHPAACALILPPLPPRAAELPTVLQVDLGLVAGAARGILPRARSGGSIYAIDAGVARDAAGLLGDVGLQTAIRELQRRLSPALLAAPREWLPERTARTVALVDIGTVRREGLQTAAARLVDLNVRDMDPDQLLAVLDAGAAGALVRSGDTACDRALLEALAERSKGAAAGRPAAAP